MIRSRTVVNLITVILASLVLALYALTQLVAGAVFGQGYPVYINLPEAGGLTDNKQVTLRGFSIGTIASVDLSGDGVVIEIDVDPDERIPTDVDVVVLRQSAIGEQALDLRPRSPIDASTQYYAEGDTIIPLSTPVLPTKPETLLTLANSVFGSVDNDNAAVVVAELADAVRGRSQDIQSILNDSASLSEAVGDNGAEYDRLFAASRIVNASLARNRDILANLLTDLADGVELIGSIRSDVDGLLDVVPPTLATTTSVLARSEANLACNIRYLANLNEYLSEDPHLEDMAESLRNQTFFFDAFRIIGPLSAQGKPWLRVHFLSEAEPVPTRYDPERPIPDTLPGGACESVFGPGAGSAVQPNHQLAVPEGRIVRPPNDRQTSFVTATPLGSAGLARRFPVPSAEAVDGG